MKKRMRAGFAARVMLAAFALTGAMCASAVGADQESAYQINVSDKSKVGSFEDVSADGADIVVLYTNDIHGAISSHEEFSGSSFSLGFAGVAGIKARAQEIAPVLLVDAGDADQGSVVTTESNGVDVMNLMRDIGYDLYAPGNHDFDYGMEEFLTYAEETGRFLSCNFIDNRSGQPVLDPYRVLTCETADGEQLRIGFIGITTPETIAKSTPTFFQDEDGNYIYGFNAATDEDLYRSVQEAANACRADGADMVIALSHLGDWDVPTEWSSLAVAANTNGIDVFLDAHAESVLPGMFAPNKDGDNVLITSTGAELETIGALMINIDDGIVSVTSNLVDKITDADMQTEAYEMIETSVEDIESKYEYLFDVEGHSNFKLTINDAEGNRIIRTRETNLGDLITDAYRDFFGADIGIMNGGSIRADINAGDIRYTDLLSVMPWNSEVTLVEMKGQTILDMLEMGAHSYPSEFGGFIQCSGMEYTIDASVPSSVVINRDNEFVSVDGKYRVKDVLVGGEPLDLEKKYSVSINRYYSQEYGDGMTMFRDAEMVKDSDENGEPYYDHDVFTAYLQNYEDSTVPDDYSNPAGQGRLTIVEGGDAGDVGEEEITEEETEEMLLDPIDPEYDFKKFCWGDSEDDIRAVEGDDIFESGKAAGYDAYYIAYDTTVVEVPVFLVYVFSDDGLMQVRYLFKQQHSDKEKYISDYKKIEREITKKYGDPVKSGENWDSDRHEELYADDMGTALTYGYLTYDTSYDLPRTTIDLTMDADNYEISTFLIYQSKELTPTEQDFSDEF